MTNDDGSFYTCPTCRKRVEPDAPGVIAAHEQIPTPDYSDGPTQFIDGTGYYFHGGCFPSRDPRYKRVN